MELPKACGRTLTTNPFDSRKKRILVSHKSRGPSVEPQRETQDQVEPPPEAQPNYAKQILWTSKKDIGGDEEAGLGPNSRCSSGAGVGMQSRVVTREAAATHAKSKDVEI
jgi:hypothetical protein